MLKYKVSMCLAHGLNFLIKKKKFTKCNKQKQILVKEMMKKNLPDVEIDPHSFSLLRIAKSVQNLGSNFIRFHQLSGNGFERRNEI